MTALDVKHAKQALSWRLAQWGVTVDVETKAASFIDDLVSQGWQMAPDRESRPRPPRNTECCRLCGRALHGPDAVCDEPTTRPMPKNPPTDIYLAAKNGLTPAGRTHADQPREGANQ